MCDQPADDLHGLPPPARPLDHQEAADRIQAACRGGGGATILTKHYYTSDEKKDIWILHAVFLITIIDIANTLNCKILKYHQVLLAQKYKSTFVPEFHGLVERKVLEMLITSNVSDDVAGARGRCKYRWGK